MALPRLLLTMGDAAGVGPEVVAASLADASIAESCRLAVIGDANALRRAAALMPSRGAPVEEVNESAALFRGESGVIHCFDPTNGLAGGAPVRQISAAAGRAAYDWLIAAADLCLSGEADGVVTAPLNKAALAAAGLNFPGHT
ncbi:MAG: 4-hydroxythreonine-4-phosphate dehydrogenase PdxA, partial [Planctomycetota bacterium]